MKTALLFLLFMLSACLPASGQSENIDTLVDVGGHRLHFRIIKGKGIPILFEAGGGDNAGIWNDILKPVADITGTTLISYDRAGFGKSEIDTRNTDIEKHGIINGIEDLEVGLKKLGYSGKIILVAHSYGGFYATLYAVRHPDLVKTAILIDASQACWFTDEFVSHLMQEANNDNARAKIENPGGYYQTNNIPETVKVMKKSAFPAKIPVIDLVSDNPPFNNADDIARWKDCHRQFAAAAPNREGITAYGSGHYIFQDNPPLVVNAIIKAYINVIDKEQRGQILQRGVAYALESANEAKKQEANYRHSEADLNSWGYSLLRQGEIEKALDVFKLNVTLHPASWNVYDSYGEILLKAGRKAEAIKIYQKSIELNPKNENGRKILEQLNK